MNRIYLKLNDLYKKREKTYASILRKYNKFDNILKEKMKKLNAEKISLQKQYVKIRRSQSVIRKIFTDDQIRALVNKSTRG